MSTINKEQEVSRKRKNPLPKEVQVSLRDQIPKKLADKLDDLNVGSKVVEMWNSHNANRMDWLQRQQELMKDWDEFYECDAEGPFQGSSNLHMPISLTVVKTVHARFLAALLGVDPYFTTKARREDSVDRAMLVQDTMGYALMDWANYRQGVAHTVDKWVWDWCSTGCGIIKQRWDCEYTRFVDVQYAEETVNVETGEEDADGNPVMAAQRKIVEKEVPVTKKTFEGPVWIHKQNEDVAIIEGEGDPQRADAVIERYWSTASEMWTLVDRKIFRDKQTTEAIDGGADYVAGSDVTDIKQSRARNNGRASLDHDADLDRWEILEAYLKMDVDGSGINSDVVVWVHKNSKKVLRATYLYRINRCGERPYEKIDFHLRAGQDYGIGLAEILHPLQKEMDAIHNQRIDYGMISNMPFGFYKPTSSIDPQTIQLEPGALIPVDNPQSDVYFPTLSNRTAWGFQEEAAIQTMIERLTGINDMSLGVMTGAQGATRTATGARALIGESNANLDVYLRRLNRGWKQALQYLLHMLQQRIPAGLSFRVTGESGSDYWQQIKSEADIAGDYDFEVMPNSANSNKQVQQEVANQVFQMTLNPLLIQSGVVGVGNIYEAAKALLKSSGVKDWGKYLTKPPQWQHMLTPEDEANRLLNGIPVPVTPEMDHAGFLAYWEEIKGSDELFGQFDKQQTLKLAAQAQKHAQMAQALQEMQAQAANAQQAQRNAANSQQQTSPGLNPMAGQPNPGSSGQG